MATGDNDYIAFGSLILNGEGAVGAAGGEYTVERATGLAGLPNPRVTITQLAGAPGAILSEIEDAERLITLEGELHCQEGRSILTQELRRFKYLLSARRGEQWLTWTPEGQASRRIKAVLQNDTDADLDVEDDMTSKFTLNFLCTCPYWEATTETSVTGNITASGQIIDLFNAGDVFAEPIIRITPTVAKGSGFAYRRWVPIYNQLSVSMIDYPVQITSEDGVSGIDHAAIVLAGKSLANGGDLQVEIDGSIAARWLVDPNTAQTKIWTNLTFQPGQSAILTENIASGSSIASISFDDTAGFPSTGILYNTNTQEAFSYTANDTTLNKVTGVTRAIKTTTAANAASGDEFQWIERDVWIVYGGGSETTWPDTNKPIFDLDTSTNVMWVYNEFGSDTSGRTGSWVRGIVWGEPKFYRTSRDPEFTVKGDWDVLGIFYGDGSVGVGRMYLYNPVGILTASFVSGENYTDEIAAYESSIQSSADGTFWSTEYVIPAPSPSDTWDTWSRDQTLAGSNSLYVAVLVDIDSTFLGTANAMYTEASKCTVTLDSDNVLKSSVLPESGGYELDATLILVDTEDGDQEAMRINYSMDLNQTLEIDCRVAQRTVTYLKDNSNQFQARTLQSPDLRNYWFRILGHWNGGKTMQMRYDETDVSGCTVVISYYSRYL